MAVQIPEDDDPVKKPDPKKTVPRPTGNFPAMRRVLKNRLSPHQAHMAHVAHMQHVANTGKGPTQFKGPPAANFKKK